MRRTLVQGTTFLLTDAAGDVTGGTEGLFLADTRHLSRWELTVDEVVPRVLTGTAGGAVGRAVLSPPERRGHDPAYTVFRRQVVHERGLTEELRLVSHRPLGRSVRIAYRVAADFADQFELRGSAHHDKPGATHRAVPDEDGLLLAYQRAEYARATLIRAGRPLTATTDTVSCRLELPAHGSVTLTVTVADRTVPPSGVDTADGAGSPNGLDTVDTIARRIEVERAGFTGRARLPEIARPELRELVRAGLRDLAALRVPAPGRPDLLVPGAGVPWFLTLFGRDSIITSLAVLPHLPELAAATLRALAGLQGTVVDPRSLEEPGRIVHEVRQGELSVFGQVPYRRYYGTVDATPLFLVLLARHRELAAELEGAARAAVDWLLRHGGLDEHGYLVYRTDGPGLVNLCWKDSARSICFASGEPAHGPIAVCEAQGYAYQALRLTAGLARDVWHDPGYAQRLERRAARLRADFVRDFWLPEAEFPALALDFRRRRVDALASNAGHLLWSGILPDELTGPVARRLAGPEFFSGWGIRTLAAGQPAYHPVSYHNGGVWPHDTAITVAGLAATGHPEQARTIAAGLLDAAAAHPAHRLPEVLAGFARAEVPEPVPYPHSAAPQAWAAAAPFLLLDALAD